MKRFNALLALLMFALCATANAQFNVEPTPTQEALAKLAAPVILAAPPNLPDVAQCHGILTQDLIDQANNAQEDPAEAFEKNRKQHPHMMMMPPPLECVSGLFKGKKRGLLSSSVTVPEGTAALLLRSDRKPEFSTLSASVGSNIELAGGVENYQGETNISVDPNNPKHLIAHSNTFFKDTTPSCQSPTGGTANTYGTMALFGSTDGGATWTYNCAPWPASVTGGVASAAYWFGSDPALAWDNQGRAYACYMLISQSAAGASGASIVVSRSTDNGTSWSSLGTVVSGITLSSGNGSGNDKQMMAIDNTTGQTFSHPGRMYVIWDNCSASACNLEKLAYSDDGASWTTVSLPSNTGAIGGNVVVGADGTVYAIWNRYNVENIVFSKSTDGGATWTTPSIIATAALQSFGSNNLPPAQDVRGINAFGSIDIDRNPSSPYFGYLYVAYNDFPTGVTTGTDLNVYVITSSNGGTSWSSRVKVNDDSFSSSQFFPWLTVDQSDGSVNISWYDTRLDPFNRKTQMFYSRSVNGGISFESNLLVADGGTNWRNGSTNFSDENSVDNTTYNSNQYGDYTGIAAANRQVHPLWTDSRSYFPLADTVSPTRREDNATSTIINCAAPGTVAAPSVSAASGPSVVVTWSAPASWGTNATAGTYSVYRATTNAFPGGSPLVSGLTSTSYLDSTGVDSVTYYYFVRAKNNCPGTTLTPMSSDSAASAPIVFGTVGAAPSILQGTITSAGNPINGATVTAGTYSATTNASGFYQFSPIDASTYTLGVSASGYTSASVNNVAVSGGATTVQNVALTPLTPSSCFTDTSYSDFVATTGASVDVSGAPGDVKLQSQGGEAPDQVSSPASLAITNTLSNTTWAGQTFRAGVTGNLTKISIGFGLNSGTSSTVTVEIRNINGTQPGTTVLATTTIGPITNVGTAALYTATFATPAAVVSGTSYSVVVRSPVGSSTFPVRGSTGSNSLANGQIFTTTTSGGTWTAVNADLYFTSYVTPPTTYALTGNITATKDSGAAVGSSATWSTLSWNATTPANTSVKFQAAGSNSAAGPFTFVGPDGTASTFFTTTGASLSQFNGKRYLRYKAILTTTDNTVTPVLNDVTVCQTVVDCTGTSATVTPAQSPVCGSSAGNTASGPAGAASYAWSITNGTITGGASSQTVTYTAGTSGTVDLSLTITTSNGCSVIGGASVTINAVPATPAINAGGATTFCTGGSVTLTSSSATGNQWYLGGSPIGGATSNTYNATASGSYTVVVTASGCASAASAATVVTVNPIPSTPTINAGGPTTFCTGGSVTLTSSSATGNQWYLDGNPIGGATSNTYNATASGSYTVVVTTSGCSSAASAGTTVTVNPIPSTPTINAGGPTTFCNGGSVTLTSSSATGNQWYLDGNPIGGATNNTYNATAAGSYTVIVTTSGCASAASSATVVTVNPLPATPTINAGGPTTFCTGGSVTLTSSSATGNQWYLDGNSIGGATSNTYNATASGSYTVVVTTSGCASAASAATVVTVNPIPSTPTINAGGPTTFCTGGSVTLTSSSATGNQWYLDGNPIGGATSNTYNATAAGSYTVVVTTSGCSSAASAGTTVTVNPIPSTPTINAGGPATFCTGGSVTLTSSSATGNQWYLDGNPIGGATSNTYNASAAGSYTVVVTTSGCSSAASAGTTVTVNPIPSTPTINAGGPTTFCTGGSVTLTSTSATGNQWYLNGNPIGGATSNTYNATASGSYTVVVTTSGCSSAASTGTTVTVNPIPATPTINAGGPTTFCNGGSVTLTSSSATGNQWYLDGNPIGGATSNTYNATASGSYTVVVTTSGCSSAASSATVVTVNPLPATPTINAGGPTTFCTGGSVTLTSSSATGNQWYLDGNPIGGATSNTYNATAAGSYTVVVTTSGCSSAASAGTTVTVNAIPSTPTINAGGPTTFCNGGSVTLTSSSATGNQWYLNGNPIGGATSNTYNATAAGSYTVVVTTSGCSSAASTGTTVTVNPTPSTPTINAGGPTTFCTGGSVTLTSSSATGNQWYLDGNPIGGATSNTYNATAAGSYTVVVTTSGCSSAASAGTTVTVNPIPSTPTINAGGPTTFCTGGSVTLTSSSATGNQWYLNGNPISGATSNTYNATAAGSYTVVVTTSGCASAASTGTTVTVNPIPSTPTINAGGPTTFCAGGSVTLTSSSATGNQWYLNGNPIGGATSNTYNASTSGNYTVVVTTSGCSSAASAATSVTVNPIPATPTINAGGPTTFCNGNSVTLTSSSATGNQWFLNGNPIGGATSNTYNATASGSYTVVVTTSGCSSAASAATVVTVNICIPTPSDLNGNHMSDITLQNTSTSAIAAWLMEDNTLVEGKVVFSPTADVKLVATGDLDGDGKADIIVKNTTTGAISMWKMNGTTLVSQTVIATPNVAQRVVGTYDFNHDGKMDIVLQNTSTGAVSLWLMNGATLTQGVALGNPGLSVKVVGLGKFGGDAILLQDTNTFAVSRWTISGNAVASSLAIGTPAANTNVVAVSDFDGDSNSDIAFQQSGTRTVSVWLVGANGTTVTQNAVVATPVFDWKVVGAGDYNGNGKGDLLLQNPSTNGIAQWQMNGVVIDRGWNITTIAGWVPLGN